jgi:hypothetical protein
MFVLKSITVRLQKESPVLKIIFEGLEPRLRHSSREADRWGCILLGGFLAELAIFLVVIPLS